MKASIYLPVRIILNILLVACAFNTPVFRAFTPTVYQILLVACAFNTSIAQTPNPVENDTLMVIAANGGKALQYLDGMFIVSSIPSNEKRCTITNPHQEVPYFYAISDDGKWLLYSIKTKAEKITYVHDLNNKGELIQTFPFALETVTLSKDGEKFFFVHSKTFWKSSLAAFDTDHWQLLSARSVPNPTSSITVNAEGTQLLLAVGSVVKVLDPQTLKTQKINWEKARLKGLVYNPTDPNQYASFNHKNNVEVRDLVEDRIVHTIRSDKGKIARLGFTPDGQRLMSIDDSGHIDVWDLQNRSKLMSMDDVLATEGFEQGNLTVLTQKGWQSIRNEWHAAPVNDTLAQPDVAFQSESANGVSMVPIPIIDYRPETSLLLGFGMGFVFHPRRDNPGVNHRFFRPTTLTPSVSYGFKGQLQAMLTADYFSERGWRFFNQVSFLNNNRSYFFGLGSDADRGISTLYRNNVFNWVGELTKAVGDRFFVGVNYQIRHDSRLDFDESAHLAVPDDKGGLLVGIGPTLRLDTRNDLFFPTSGYYVDLSYTRYDDWLESNYQYSNLKLDFRGFYALPILTTGTTLAIQGLYHGTFNGDAPFYQLPYLSSDRILRGVWRNLYIDQQALSVQGELRSDFSNIDPRYGYVVFAGAGDVAPNLFRGYDPDIIGVFGVGYRQQMIPKLKLQSRVDFSVTTKGNIGIFGGVGLTF